MHRNVGPTALALDVIVDSLVGADAIQEIGILFEVTGNQHTPSNPRICDVRYAIIFDEGWHERAADLAVDLEVELPAVLRAKVPSAMVNTWVGGTTCYVEIFWGYKGPR